MIALYALHSPAVHLSLRQVQAEAAEYGCALHAATQQMLLALIAFS